MFAGALVCVYLTVGLPMAIRERLFIWLALGLAIYFGNGRAGATRERDVKRLGNVPHRESSRT